MTIPNVKQNFETKIRAAGGLTPPLPIDLSEIIFEALIYVATRCLPRELLRYNTVDTNETVLRLIADGYFIIEPKKPIFDDTNPAYSALEHLQIDEDLNYAVINKACALYSRELKTILKFEQESTRVINRYKANYNKVGE